MGIYSDLLFGPSDAQLEDVQSPIERPAPIARPGGGAALPSAGASKIPQWGPNEVPQSFFLPNEEINKLSPQDRDAYLKQRSEWFDYRQGTGRFAPKPGQAPRPSAAPAVPPQSAPVSPQAVPVPHQAVPRQSYSDQMFGVDDSVPQPKPGKPAPSADAEPDAATWLGRRAQDIIGKQDKRYSNLPTISEALNAEGSMGLKTAGREMWGWLTDANDQEQAKVFKGILGDRYVRTEQDANGYPIVVYKGKDGAEAKAYVNKPGLDAQDVVRGIVGIAPNIGAGRLVGSAMRGSNFLGRSTAQAIGQGATSVAQDAAGIVTGTRNPTSEDVAKKGLFSAAGGAAGEAIAAPVAYAWRKLVTEPRYFNRATGELTEEGIKAAEAAGMDAKSISSKTARQFASEMARTADPVAATSQVAANEFNIRRTPGELTKDIPTLIREQQIAGGNYGRGGAERMRTFRDLQKEDIESAVRGMADEMAPGRAGQSLGKADLGANIRANTEASFDAAKEFEKKAWKDVPELKANNDALSTLDESISKGLKGRGIDFIESDLTPAAAKMSKMLQDFEAGGAPQSASKYIKSDLPGDVELMRRQLSKAYGAAENPTDKRAAKAIYDSYNDWTIEAAKMAGDPMASFKMRAARTLSREIHEAFDGASGTQGEKILGKVLKDADSAEGVIDALFAGQTRSNVKSGSIDALNRLLDGYRKYLPADAAQAAKEDLKLAYFMRGVTKNGEIMDPKALSSSLKNMVASQRSVLTALGVSKEEMSRIGRLAGLLEDVARRNPNTSWSGVTMSQFLKEGVGALFTMLGGNSIATKVIAGPVMRQFQEPYGRALASKATGGLQGARVSRLIPPFAGPAGGLASSDSR